MKLVRKREVGRERCQSLWSKASTFGKDGLCQKWTEIISNFCTMYLKERARRESFVLDKTVERNRLKAGLSNGWDAVPEEKIPYSSREHCDIAHLPGNTFFRVLMYVFIDCTV